MGCGSSTASPTPKNPEDSWYAKPYSYKFSMPITPFHEERKGNFIFASQPIGLSESDSKKVVPLLRFKLGHDSIFSMGYLHSTPMRTEHVWHTRPEMFIKEGIKVPDHMYGTPNEDTRLGILVKIDGIPVEDLHPSQHALPGCTTTYEAPFAPWLWMAVPAPLFVSPRYKLVTQCSLYLGLIYNFAKATEKLSEGIHTVSVEACYGSKSEGFLSKFVAIGEMELEVVEGSSKRARHLAKNILPLWEEAVKKPQFIPNPSSPHNCHRCRKPRDVRCTICMASLCHTEKCLSKWNSLDGYPSACPVHDLALIEKARRRDSKTPVPERTPRGSKRSTSQSEPDRPEKLEKSDKTPHGEKRESRSNSAKRNSKADSEKPPEEEMAAWSQRDPSEDNEENPETTEDIE